MTRKTPQLSILVPIYNVERYLEQCLESLVNQTLKDIEIICLNDGSTDSSSQILQAFQKRDPRIRVINKPNSGYGDSMNQGLKKATGEYIGIVESDDYIDLDAFEKLYQLAKREQADLVKANYYKLTTKNSHESNQLVHEIQHYQVINPNQDRFVFEFAPAIWSAIYKRKFLEKNQIKFLPTPGASYQDLSFSFKAWALAQKVVLTPDAYIHYRIDNTSSSVNHPGKVDCVVEEYAEIEQFLKKHNLFSDFNRTMLAAKFRNYHWNFQRLSPALARQFYQTWHQEMSAAQNSNLLDRSAFRSKDWIVLQVMLKSPQLAYQTLKLRKRFHNRKGNHETTS